MQIRINFRTLWDSGNKAEKDTFSKTCIHSGNSGDIIYSLPTVKELGVEHFVINLCRDTYFKGRNIDFDTAKALSPLLLAQPYIKRVSIVSSNLPLEYLSEPIEGVEFNLDKFRLQDVFKNHLGISHAKAFGIHVNLYEKWLHAEGDGGGGDYIVISLTPRYRSKTKEYWLDVLAGLDNIIVIGIPEEFDSLSGLNANFVTCKDFLEMARIIDGCSLFIGNPSLSYAIAEGLKVPRIVELPHDSQNAYPIGQSGYVVPNSIKEARNLIERLVSTSPEKILNYQNVTLTKEIANLEAILKDKDTHIRNIEAVLKDKDTHIGNLEAAIKERDNHICNLEAIIKDKDVHISNLETHIKNVEAYMKGLQTHIDNVEAHTRNLETHIINVEPHVKNLEVAIKDKDTHIQNMESLLKEKETTLNNIYRSRGWKVLHTYYKLKGSILHLIRGSK